MYRFALPDIGEGVVEAEIVEWKVAEGDAIALDQPLVVLLTDKAEIEVPSPRAGRVARLAFRPGQTARVGDVLVEIDEGAQSAQASVPAERAQTQANAAAPAIPATADAPGSPATAAPPRMPRRPSRERPGSERGGPHGLEAVPAVRELARRLGVDLAQVGGSGPGGRIMRRDVEAFAAAGPAGSRTPALPAAEPHADPADWRREPLRGLRRAIAERMALSRRTAAHFTYVDEVDMTELLAAIEGSALAGSSPLAFIAHACVRALADFPALNASIDDARGEIVYKGSVHLGIATATDGGLVVPVIRDAAALGVADLARRIGELAERARGARMAPGELSGSTFTITSLGKLGGVISTPILNPPEVAILGVNAIRRLPRMRGDEVRARQVMNLSLSVDHRIADGLVAARFIEELRRRLEGAAFDELKPGETAR
jgi:pyruvate/2-oxoglutarate dehydrogenase complex dihydrolipoamide acyltransferase (E2) component